jgi:hypothetical protein
MARKKRRRRTRRRAGRASGRYYEKREQDAYNYMMRCRGSDRCYEVFHCVFKVFYCVIRHVSKCFGTFFFCEGEGGGLVRGGRDPGPCGKGKLQAFNTCIGLVACVLSLGRRGETLAVLQVPFLHVPRCPLACGLLASALLACRCSQIS